MKKMNILKKGLVLLFSCVAIAGVLAACSPSADESADTAEETATEATEEAAGDEAAEAEATETEVAEDALPSQIVAAAAPEDSVSKQVHENGVVRVGIANNNPPMNYLDDDGNWIGFDVDLAQALADHMGVELEMVEVNNDTRISYLANNTTDMSITNLSHTTDRDAQIDFAEPSYIWDGKVAFVRKGEFTDMMELAGKKIAVDQGSSAYKAVETYITENGGEAPIIEEYQGNAACFQALKDGKVDAFTQDSLICQGVAGEDADDFEVLGSFYSGSLYGIGVPSNDSAWRDEVSFALQELMADGTYDQIYDKWFGEDGMFPMPYSVKPVLSEEFGDHVLYTWPE